MKNIFFYEGNADPKIARLLESQFGQAKIINLSEDIFAGEKFPSFGKIMDIHDFLNREELTDILSDAKAKSKTLFNFCESELVYDNELSFLEALAFEIEIFIIEIFLNISLLEKVFSQEPSATFITYKNDSLFHHCCRKFCSSRGIGLKIIGAEKLKGNLLIWKYKEMFTLKKFILVKILSAFDLVHLLTLRRRQDKKRSILIMNYFRFKPLIDSLSRDKGLRLFVLQGGSRGEAKPKGAHGNVYYPFLLSYLNLQNAVSLLTKRSSFAVFSKKIIKGFKDREIIYKKTNISAICRDALLGLFKTRVFNYICFYEAGKRLLEKEDISVIVMPQSNHGYNKIISTLGRKRNIRTITFQHGLTHDVLSPPLSYDSEEVFVWGMREKELYIKNGLVPEYKINVVGDPLLGQLKKRDFNKTLICKALNISENKLTILFVCERYTNDFIPYLKPTSVNAHLDFLTKFFSGKKEMQLVVRTKPFESYSFMGASFDIKRMIIEENNSGNVFIDASSDIYDLLYIAELVIVTTSTVGLEAMLFKKPVIIINFEDKKQDIDTTGYLRSKAALMVSCKEEFPSVLHSALNDRVVQDDLSRNQDIFLRNNFANLNDSDPLEKIRQGILASHER